VQPATEASSSALEVENSGVQFEKFFTLQLMQSQLVEEMQRVRGLEEKIDRLEKENRMLEHKVMMNKISLVIGGNSYPIGLSGNPSTLIVKSGEMLKNIHCTQGSQVESPENSSPAIYSSFSSHFSYPNLE
jgi:hypothetical protein